MISFDVLENELALKAVAWDFEKGEFVSPSKKDFTWSKDGLEAADCKVPSRKVYGTVNCTPCINPPYLDRNIPGDDCTCGLYATFRWNIVLRGYISSSIISPVLLTEVAGKSILYDEGVRAYQLTVKAAIRGWWDEYDERVRQKLSLLEAATYQAADYFNVPVVFAPHATIAMDIWNIKCNLDTWKDWYTPESPEVRGMPEDSIVELADTYFPEHEKEVTWESLLSAST